MSTFYPGQTTTEMTKHEAAARALARRAAAEGMVLLENKGVLPLPAGTSLALFGNGARHTVKGGTGSGDVNARDIVSVYDGLVNAGFRITSEGWLDRFDNEYQEAVKRWEQAIYEAAGPERDADRLYKAHASLAVEWPEIPIARDDLGDASCVVYVISRISGEAADRKEEKGDYYLSDLEEEQLRTLASFDLPLIILLNVGGVMDLSFLDEIPVSAVLLMSQAGSEGGNAAADVLTGRENPSGCLTDTWAYHYSDYPSSADFGSRNGNLADEYYTDGIYVGYRYFDTFRVPVRYPFGYGLSYTEFSVEAADLELCAAKSLGGIEYALVYDGTPGSRRGTMYSDETRKLFGTVQEAEMGQSASILCRLWIKNTGFAPGKHVVQLYASCSSGRLPVERKRLISFAKTTLLEPEETQLLEVSFPLYSLAVYDEGQAAYILQKGTYEILIGENAEKCSRIGRLVLKQETVAEQLSNICQQLDALKEIVPEPFEEDCTSVSAVQPYVKEIDISRACEGLAGHLGGAPGGERGSEVLKKEVKKIAARMSDQEKACLVVGARSAASREVIGNAASSVPGAAGQTVAFPEYGIPSLVLADGPAGIRVQKEYETDPRTGEIYQLEDMFSRFENRFFGKMERHEGAKSYYQFATAFPVGTLLAQTFDLSLLEEVGEMIAKEMEMFGVHIWLGPGMNIHRNPLCGRNYEYYSEDPLLTGETAAAITRGVQSTGKKGVCIKHFACNNQEDNRMHVTAVISERALREIYLKGFEIAVKKSSPVSIMTSYNRINSVHAANSYDLCTTVARKEWGFDGFIMTDWTTTNGGGSSAAKCIAAGNDLVMPGRDSDIREILDALEGKTQAKLDREALDRSVQRIICAAKSGQ